MKPSNAAKTPKLTAMKPEAVPTDFLLAAGFRTQQELEAYEQTLVRKIRSGQLKVNPRALRP